MVWRHVVPGLFVAAAVVAACGGRSVRHGGGPDPEETGGTGLGGSGGTASGATGGTVGGAGGVSIHPPVAGTGGSGGTGTLPPPDCNAEGLKLAVGDSVELLDGCTQCTCFAFGLDCDSSACEGRSECENIEQEYQNALLRARWCGFIDLSIEDQEFYRVCPAVALLDPECGCPVVVRGNVELGSIREQWSRRQCATFRPCPPCTPLQGRHQCGPDGFCRDGG